ncbi:hypothetical protein HU230_0028220 [Bradyrhizobium quebecense]|uniref:Multi-ubiquitin domain-containing protein n=1 Tax=Bradyrhizobium quebecense TaxID=2748629 RepID=A0A973WMI0_9BRAD|nr:hypothetical protein [Bradyrhizobium quebecense]UGA42173.1 hypothetical protein HU230_0028220 [Bradyrhizobium quebecense]
MSEAGKIDVKVRYPEDDDKLHDHKVHRDETLGSFKSRVLVAFGLTEGVDEKGELITFGLFHEHKALKEPETLGSVAGDADELHLKLERQRHYFFYKKHEIRSATPTATGARIKAMIKAVDPDFDLSHTLIEEGHGHGEDKVIEDGQIVSLKVDSAHPVKHFFSKPPTNFGAR